MDLTDDLRQCKVHWYNSLSIRSAEDQQDNKHRLKDEKQIIPIVKIHVVKLLLCLHLLKALDTFGNYPK